MTQATDIMFYLNLALLFCALTAVAAIAVLRRKTACAGVAALVAVIVFIAAGVMYAVQLFMYVFHSKLAYVAVYIATGVLYAGFVAAAAYAFMLTENRQRTFCIIVGITCFIPPLGAVMLAILSRTMRVDTRMKNLVYSGYAYTYAALGQFCARNKPEFIDTAEVETYEKLTGKQLNQKLRELKKQAKTPEGRYNYATTVAVYIPEDRHIALRYMKKAAKENYAPALFNLGYYYETGLYVKKDAKKAGEYYTRAKEHGDADATLRLGILQVTSGDVQAGMDILRALADGGDLCAKYDLGICAERGIGGAVDMQKAVDIYCECAKEGMFLAEKRIFVIAATDITSAQNGGFFRSVTDRKFEGNFAVMIDGLIQIKKRLAADAAEKFLAAVKAGGDWEGFARCLVGTLYVDCGKDKTDKMNGVDYIVSALPRYRYARSVYEVLPHSLVRDTEKRRRAAD